ncbi:MAG: cytochrome c-type biogenesis protein [Parvibaculales bacterium]
MMRVVILLSLLATSLNGPTYALDPGEALTDARLEARARALSQELRCMVCQNQSIDDSDAPLAKDLRVFVRNRLRAGDSDAAIRDAIVLRYGEFALFRPRIASHTLALWLTPLTILLFGALFGWRLTRASRHKSERQNTSTTSE